MPPSQRASPARRVQGVSGSAVRRTLSLGSLEVDDQLEFRGLLHGEVGWVSAFEDLVYIGGRAPMPLRQAWPIGHQPPSLHIHFPAQL